MDGQRKQRAAVELRGIQVHAEVQWGCEHPFLPGQGTSGH